MDQVLDAHARTGVGVLYLLSALFILPLQIGICFILYIHRDFWSLMAFKIMFSVGVLIFFQIFGHFYSGLMTLAQGPLLQWLDNIVAAFANAAMVALSPQLTLLALNRLVSIRVVGERTSQNNSFYLLLAMCWLWFLLFLFAYLSPYTGVSYNPIGLFWDYTDGPWSHFTQSIDFYTAIVIQPTTFVLYIVVIVLLHRMRRTTALNLRRHNRNEMRLFMQNFVVFAYSFWLTIAWHTYSIILPNSPWTVVGINYLWVLLCILNPIMVLAVSKQIRSRLFALARCRPHTQDSFVINHIPQGSSRVEPGRLPK